MPVDLLTPENLDVALELSVRAVQERAGTARLGSDPPDQLVRERCRSALTAYVEAPDRFAYLATDDEGRAEALVGGLLTRLTPQDEAFTYAAPVSVVLPLTGWGARDAAAAVRCLPMLHAAVVRHAAAESVERIDVQVLESDWVAASVWRSLGLRPCLAFAARPLRAPDRPVTGTDPAAVRRAGEADLPRMGELLVEEIRYHAHHTIGGVSPDQDPATIARIVGGSVDHDAAEHVGRSFVHDEGGEVLGLSTVHIVTTPEQSVARYFLPGRYAYIALTSVIEQARGRGIGAVLAQRAMEWARSVTEPPEVICLHYATDNVLSAPFWSSRGYAAVVSTLTNAGGLPVGEGA